MRLAILTLPLILAAGAVVAEPNDRKGDLARAKVEVRVAVTILPQPHQEAQTAALSAAGAEKRPPGSVRVVLPSPYSR